MSLNLKEISFKKKLVLLVTTAILLPLLSASIIFGSLLNRQFDSIYANRLQAGMQLLSLMIHNRNNELKLSLSKAATDNTLQMTMFLEIIPQLSNYLSSQITVLGLSSLGVANAGRRILAKAGADLEYDIENQDTQLLVKGRRVHLYHVTPVQRDGKLFGYVAGAVEITSDQFLHSLRDAMSEHFILWVGGQPVLSDLDIDSQQITSVPNFGGDANGAEIILSGLRYRAINSTKYYGNTPITLSVVIPKAELTRSFQQMTVIIGLLVLLLFTIIMAILHRVIRGLAVPVQDLTAAAERLEKGEYKVPQLDYNRLDEFGALNKTFRGMAVALQHHISDMEEVVMSRTTELSAANTALMNDMIQRERTEREKTQLEEQLFQARKLESIGILAGGIAHDFNNMLTGIINNVSLAKLYLKPEDKAYSVLDKTESATLRASDLTQQLLTFSKGGAPIKRTASILDLVRESAAFVLRGSNVKCVYELASDLWAVDADVGQISQVVHNLTLNADQAMAEGGTLIISAENVEIEKGSPLPLKPGCFVKLCFRDMGPGIAPADLDNVFVPYFSTKQEGNGLGLATSYSIIKNHDGYLTVESKVGQGATFILYIPAAKGKNAELVKGGSEVIYGSGRVLFMDDDVTIRETICDAMTLLGYKVASSPDGEDTLALYKEAMAAGQPFDVVILDLTIPGGMGGAATIDKLLQIDPGVKAIVSSGYSDDRVMANYEDYGFMDVVPKPYRVEQLSAILFRMINADK